MPLVGGGLMLRSFWNLTHAPIGFDPSGIVTARIQMSFRAFPDLESRLRLIRDAIDQVSQLPGVEAATAAAPLPMATEQQEFRKRRRSRFRRSRQPAASAPRIPRDHADATDPGPRRVRR